VEAKVEGPACHARRLVHVKAIVTGLIGSYPLGGVAWDYGQYLLGLERLGFEVVYLEDSGFDLYDPRSRSYGAEAGYAVDFIQATLGFLLPGGCPWHLRGPDGRTYGITPERVLDEIATADIFLNVSNSALLRPDYLLSKRKVMIDTDPGWNQFVALPKWDTGAGWDEVVSFRAHDTFFSYAEAFSTPGCTLPTLGVEWLPTRPPVVTDLWHSDGRGANWTTVMNWESYPLSIDVDGRHYGGKSSEMLAVVGLPEIVDVPLELAVDGKAPLDLLARNRWRVVNAPDVSADPASYQAYIQGSRGEFSIAKNVYVATGSGWFSCRSVCYLAAGLPVVLQDTGYSSFIETGEGLLAWGDIGEAKVALERVETDYETHRRAAQELATRYFSADVVLGDLLARAGVG
jgi:hypothetical protein